MGSRLFFVVTLCGIIAGHVSANTLWTGAVSDSWFDPDNWGSGIPEVAGERAQIESSTDLAYWPVIKSGETVDLDERIFLPLSPAGSGQTMYGRLTVESGGALNVSDDFRAGDDNGAADQQMVGSFVVAGSVTFSDTARFGNNDFQTMTVEVTGSLFSTADGEDFRIGGGDGANVPFYISGNGLVSVAGPFEMDDGGLLSLSDDGTLTLHEHEVEDDDIFTPFTKSDIIDLVTEYIEDGLMQGLTNTFSGGQTLTLLGNGVAYFEGDTSIGFVSAVPEPSAVCLLLLGGMLVGCDRRIRSCRQSC